MTNESGKHSALRQTDDGSFELVSEDLHEISESEASFADEVSEPRSDEPTQKGGSSRIVLIGAAAVAVLAIVAAIAWGFTGSSDEEPTVEEPEEPAGFRPYAGGPESDEQSAPRREAVAARPEPEPESDQIEEPDEVEEDPGWELSENGIVVEDEGVPDEEEEVEEITEDEEIPPDVLSAAREVEQAPKVRGDRRLEALRDLQGALPSPNTPAVGLGKTPNIYGNVRKRPVRKIDPSTGTLKAIDTDAVGESDSEEGPVE